MNWIAAKLLCIWWSSPESSVVDWFLGDWWESVLEMWKELPESEGVNALCLAAESEGRQAIGMEYERLFVGPASVPCPPYEAMWQTDRPRHEQGMVTGEVTLVVRQLYADAGFRMKQDCHEFADHVAIEFEALAEGMELAWKAVAKNAESAKTFEAESSVDDAENARAAGAGSAGSGPAGPAESVRGAKADMGDEGVALAAKAVELLARDHLGKWIPLFCAKVIEETKLDFYRILAGLTIGLTRRWSAIGESAYRNT